MLADLAAYDGYHFLGVIPYKKVPREKVELPKRAEKDSDDDRKLDRFARGVSHLLRALETFQALGIHFASLPESLDTSTLDGKMVFTVLPVCP